MAAAPVAQEPWAGPAQGAVGAPSPAEARSDLVRDWDTVPDPLGGETLPSRGVRVAELGHLEVHEERAIRCRAPLAGRGEL